MAMEYYCCGIGRCWEGVAVGFLLYVGGVFNKVRVFCWYCLLAVECTMPGLCV